MFSIVKLIPLLGLACSLTLAQAETTKPPKLTKWDIGSDIIAKDLDLPGKGLNQTIQQIAFDLRSSQLLCKKTSRTSAISIAECLRGTEENNYSGALKPYISYALKKNKIDKIEAATMVVAISSIQEVKGDKLEDIVIGDTLLKAPQGKGATLPSLLVYRQNKKAFAALRKAKKREEVLPKELLDQMMKKLPRTVNGVGTVNAEQFLAAQMGRLQLNTLAGVMVTATDFMTRPNARIILYPADYSFTTNQLKLLQEKEIALAQQILDTDDLEERTAMQAELQELLEQTNKYKKKNIVDQLINQRAIKTEELHDQLIQLASLPLNDEESRTVLKNHFQQMVTELNEIDQKLANLIRVEELPPEDLQRFVMNSLKADFQELMQTPAFFGSNLAIADTLLAAWVAGDISSEALVALSQQASLKEVHTSVWKKALSITWAIGKTALMAFPATSYIAIGISIFENINKTIEAQKENTSNETHLIPLS